MSGDSITHGKQRDQPQDKSIKMLEEPRPPQAPQTMDVASASTSGSQCWSMDGIQQKQLRPSVLCQLSQTASRQQQAASICKDELDADHPTQSSSPHVGPPPRHHYLFPLRAESPKQSSSEAERHDGVSGKISASFVSGLCRWPGCDVVSEDFSSYLKHLRSEHRHSDRSLAQWKVQQDIVHCMENQLIVEKEKLFAMQLHLHLSEHKYSDVNPASAWPPCLPLVLPPPAGRAPAWSMKHLDQLSQQGHQAAASVHLLPDLVPSIECYKYNNIRPPFTYAYLIRWAILEAPDQQRSLNDIYTWFTTMFFYFRHNTATWKNAVRHNLSLHKCFVRVEGGKGAVWTVDESEYQRRKGQKFHRDCPMKWLKSCPLYCPEDP
ncbi:forkhead box protein P2-like isoform X2 [Antennarius striatus]|uniref:forkhead box protein P2-like isoform X2 n=1 Tax=Antennarius striatus TaxID=241820 RepID=UPI0035B1F864